MSEPFTLEDIFTGAGFAGVPGSPLQLAICRTARGLPLDGVLSDDELQRYFGTTELPSTVPQIVELVTGVRSGKSWLAACAAIHAALTSPLTKAGRKLKQHELPRVPIVGPDVDCATATFVILRGIIESSPILKTLLVGEPTSDTIVLLRPDGYKVEIVVVAASRGGRTMRNRWLAGYILEELAQIGSSTEERVVNGEDLHNAGRTRLLDGCQGWLISSPFGPQGLLFNLWKRHFGKPGRTLVIHAPTRAMNPSHPQSEIDDLAADDPDTAAREFGAEWTDPESAYFESVLVDAAIRQSPETLLPVRGESVSFACAMDAATRGNAWTFVVAGRRGDRVVIFGAWERRGSRKVPLSPKVIFQEFRGILAPYRIRSIYCDMWSFDANADHARDAGGFTLVQRESKEDQDGYAKMRSLLGNSTLELPPVPNVRTDLLAVRRRVTSSSVSIVLPDQGSGRHCDFAPSIAVAVARAMSASRVDWSSWKEKTAGLSEAFSYRGGRNWGVGF